MTKEQEARGIRRELQRREEREGRRVAERIVKVVNRRKPNQFVLDLVETWIAAGYRLNKWGRRDSFKEQTRYRTFSLYQGSGPVKFEARWGYPATKQSSITDDSETAAEEWKDYAPPPDEGDEGYEEWLEEQEELEAEVQEVIQEATERVEMLTLFFRFLTGPYYDKIGRCPRCQMFWLNTSGRSDKTYCSNKCASAVTARRTLQEQRQQKREAKFDLVRQALENFSALPREKKARLRASKDGETQWLARTTGLTKHFVTRALNQMNTKRKEV